MSNHRRPKKMDNIEVAIFKRRFCTFHWCPPPCALGKWPYKQSPFFNCRNFFNRSCNGSPKRQSSPHHLFSWKKEHTPQNELMYCHWVFGYNIDNDTIGVTTIYTFKKMCVLTICKGQRQVAHVYSQLLV